MAIFMPSRLLELVLKMTRTQNPILKMSPVEGRPQNSNDHHMVLRELEASRWLLPEGGEACAEWWGMKVGVIWMKEKEHVSKHRKGPDVNALKNRPRPGAGRPQVMEVIKLYFL